MSNQPTIDDVERIAHAAVRDCYQCGKCSAGCPMAHAMDLLPNQLVRWVQLGRIDKAMRAHAVWQCVSCMTCSTRCPKSVNCAGVLDALRQLSVQYDAAAPGQRRTIVFQRAFLDNIRRNGRLRELELIGAFKTKAFLGDLNIPLLMKDALLAPRMMRRGRLRLFGQRVKDRGVVERIFERCQG
jgi:heterodisulfide reductase subunit C